MNSAIIEGLLFGLIPVITVFLVPMLFKRRMSAKTQMTPQPSGSASSQTERNFESLKEKAIRNFESLRELDLRYLNVQDATIDNMLFPLSKGILSEQEISEIIGNPIEYPIEKINKIAVSTALKYWNGEMEYLDGDCIMNNIILQYSIFGNFSINPFEKIGFAWECYLAFDSGEFYRSEDGPDVDPAEKYTRPYVEEILRMTKLIN